MSTYTLRLYEHPDTRARAVDLDGCELVDAPEVEAHGWNHGDGDTVEIGRVSFVLMSGVGATGIFTDDVRGHYIEALATEPDDDTEADDADLAEADERLRQMDRDEAALAERGED